jgi:phage-related protein
VDALKPVLWVGSSLKDLRAAPDDVRSVVGHALDLAQRGDKHPDAKPLKGFGGAQVLEVVVDSNRCTYRGVYTVRHEGVVFVLHVFQKKSTKGSKTNQGDIELIRKRLLDAESMYESREAEFKERERQRKARLQ